MKRILQASTLLLAISGAALTPWVLEGNDLLTWGHLILGFFYSVVFLLFCYDHVTQHQALLKTGHPRNLTGTLQIVFGIVLLLSGFVLYLYGSQRMSPVSEIHLGATLLFFAALSIHFKSPVK